MTIGVGKPYTIRAEDLRRRYQVKEEDKHLPALNVTDD